MIPRRVRLAVLIAFLCHGLFILTAHYRFSYDAYTHMLFANHYAENWFSLWEPRWYTGFTVVSYPPLTHQLIAPFVPLLGFDAAFAFILWLVTTLYPLGIYSFSRIFTGKSAASYASLASAVLLPIYVTAYIFGQLPFLTSTLIALFGAASLACYLRQGSFHDFVLAIALAATAMAAHHATLIVQPFFIIAVIISQINKNNWRAILFRFSIFSAMAVVAGLWVIWPFWQWGMYQTMQTPIDHLSRHNFFSDPLALAIFFLPLYGPLALVIPFVFRKWPIRFWGLLLSFVTLFLLGLGGTTPLPRLFFGGNWEWLTYDRFAFWACLTLTPFFGTLLIQWRYRWRNRVISKPIPVALGRDFPPAFTSLALATTALGAWFAPFIFPTQPAPIDMRPIVDFLNQENRSEWRYLTFGFGNQFAYLNLLTTATTIDGSYNTVRTIPELRRSGIAEVDTSYWNPMGVSAIEPILKISGEYGVRWGFVNPATLSAVKLRWGSVHRSPFVPTLEILGWVKKEILSNRILVYENPQAVLPGPIKTPKPDSFTSFSWGVFPALSLITTLSLGALRVYPAQAERVIRTIYSVTVALIPVSLCFWFYKSIFDSPHPRVYFTYTHALFYLSDALILAAVLLWLAVRVARSSNDGAAPTFLFQLSTKWPISVKGFLHSPSSIILVLFTLFLLCSVSLLWSRDWHISLHLSLHFWLIFLLVLSLREWLEAWKFASIGLCMALCVEMISGFIGFASQSTAFLERLNMQWPGILDPSIRGASVVQLTDGLRILRAYGTLPHPNILGGFALLTLLGPASLFLMNTKPNYPALILLTLGIILITITFSRSAWLGLVAFMTILILKLKHLERRRLFLLLAASALTIFLTVYPLRELVFVRVSNAPIATEQLSTFGRFWLNQQALDMFRAQPLTGVGIGSFITHLSTYAIQGAPIEPVHSMLLLVASELGIFGVLLVMGLFIVIAWKILKARSTKAILASAVITGLGVISLFDHYLWTLAPGRIMLALAFGLWLGQMAHDA